LASDSPDLIHCAICDLLRCSQTSDMLWDILDSVLVHSLLAELDVLVVVDARHGRRLYAFRVGDEVEVGLDLAPFANFLCFFWAR
jgi:hypothetical protein